MAHTPGPWEVEEGLNDAVIYAPNDGTVCIVTGDLNDAPANADLIAAAPDMYGACKMAYKLLWEKGHTIETGEVLNSLGDAIAKAEGK
jgi:hypothetical protein